LTGGIGAINLEGAGEGVIRTSALALIGMATAVFCAGQTTITDTYAIIVTGAVTMEDGSPPPFIVGIERVCSDPHGDAPGPITNKKGEWVWRMQFRRVRSALVLGSGIAPRVHLDSC
jgi:hypothetical protein